MADQARTLFDAWEPIIRRHSTKETSEIEIRIGKMNRGSFDTNVTQAVHDKALRRLYKYTGWEDVTESDTIVYHYPSSRRATYDNDKEDITESVIKRRLEVNDFSLVGQPFDVRLGVSAEIPADHDPNEEATMVRSKKRVSFTRKNLRIDVTSVTGDSDDPDCDEETQYQIELELLAVPESKNELFNMVYKIFDVLCITA
jgi:hypothetical protein